MNKYNLYLPLDVLTYYTSFVVYIKYAIFNIVITSIYDILSAMRTYNVLCITLDCITTVSTVLCVYIYTCIHTCVMCLQKCCNRFVCMDSNS